MRQHFQRHPNALCNSYMLSGFGLRQGREHLGGTEGEKEEWKKGIERQK